MSRVQPIEFGPSHNGVTTIHFEDERDGNQHFASVTLDGDESTWGEFITLEQIALLHAWTGEMLRSALGDGPDPESDAEEEAEPREIQTTAASREALEKVAQAERKIRMDESHTESAPTPCHLWIGNDISHPCRRCGRWRPEHSYAAPVERELGVSTGANCPRWRGKLLSDHCSNCGRSRREHHEDHLRAGSAEG